jgi:hypothetical protein
MSHPASGVSNQAGNIKLRKTGTFIGAEISGIDLRLPLDQSCRENGRWGPVKQQIRRSCAV